MRAYSNMFCMWPSDDLPHLGAFTSSLIISVLIVQNIDMSMADILSAENSSAQNFPKIATETLSRPTGKSDIFCTIVIPVPTKFICAAKGRRP